MVPIHQWGSTKKIQVKHDLGRRLYGGQGKKEYDVHICVMLALQCMHDNLLKRVYVLLGVARKVVPISENRRRKSKLNTTSCQCTSIWHYTIMLYMYVICMQTWCRWISSCSARKSLPNFCFKIFSKILPVKPGLHISRCPWHTFIYFLLGVWNVLSWILAVKLSSCYTNPNDISCYLIHCSGINIK